jgi:small-conductance mechanosensitive channel
MGSNARRKQLVRQSPLWHLPCGKDDGIHRDHLGQAIAGDVQAILSEPEVDSSAVHVYFRDFTPSSLDVWVFYRIRDPDLRKHLALRQRLNLAFMRLVEARGLVFAFPNQSYVLQGADAGRVVASGPARSLEPR